MLLAAAFALASELVARDGVGVGEYVVGVVVVLGLLSLAARLVFRARLG